MDSSTAEKAEETFSIRVAARLSGISADTLRMWERRYGFPNPRRLPNGNRVYSASTVQRLILIARAIEAGFRPGEVVRQPAEALESLLAVSAEQVAPTPGGSEPWRPAMNAIVRSDVDGMRRQLRQLVATFGARRFVTDVIAPLLVEIGRAWTAGTIDIRHEHLASEAITTQIRTLLATFEETPGHPTVLVGTLPREPHRLGMEMAALYLAAHGALVRLIGADTPADQIVAAAIQLEADVVAISISPSTDPLAAGGYLKWMLAELPENVQVWIGGSNALRVRESHPRLRTVATWDNIDIELARARARVVGNA